MFGTSALVPGFRCASPGAVVCYALPGLFGLSRDANRCLSELGASWFWYKGRVVRGFGLIVVLLLAAGVQAAEWSDDFGGGLESWLVPLPADWVVADEGGDPFLRLAVGWPIGKPRRPVKFAVYTPACVGDLEMTVRLRRKETSLILVFGYQDRSRFYYTHLSSDDGNESVHNGLFKVHGGARYRIAGLGSAPALPTEAWHSVRVVRGVSDGRIRVFIDEDAEPRFEALDKSFLFGRVGLGSFDETGDFDDFRLTGEPSELCATSDLSPLDP